MDEQFKLINDLEVEVDMGLFDKMNIKDQDEIFIVTNFFLGILEGLKD